MNSTNCPFYIVEEFISPLLCEQILDAIDFSVPDANPEGHELKTTRTNDIAESIVYQKLLTVLPEIQAHYKVLYKGTERIQFEWFPPGYQGQFNCENSEYLRGKWLRTKNRDFTAILFLCDYQDNIPFEQDYEVYGGKLEFPQHHFGFNPQRGTLVVFPSDPHFINCNAIVQAGDLFQARIHIAASQPYLYMPENFPGNYTTWFR